MKNFTILNIFFLVALFSIENLNAQIVIGAPNLGFSQACAGPSFNTYNVTFTFSMENNAIKKKTLSIVKFFISYCLSNK